MQTLELDPEKVYRAHDVRLLDVLPRAAGESTPFFAAWAILSPGEVTRAHRHDERETFFMFDGVGEVRCDGVSAEVAKGSVIHFEPFERHELANTGDRDLIFLSVVWRDSKAAAERVVAAPPGIAPRRPRRHVIAASPTPNGDLHVGHISGPYLGADVHTRYLRMRGFDAVQITGSDDYQSYVATKGDALNLGAAETADRYAARIQAAFEAMSIAVDHIARPLHSEAYRRGVTELFRRLYESGAIYEAERPGLFDSAHGRYLYEGLASGSCPYCAARTSGNICEECGHPTPAPTSARRSRRSRLAHPR